MAAPHKIFKISLPLYKTDMLVCLGISIDKWAKRYGEEFNATLDSRSSSAEACCFRKEPGVSSVCCLWFANRNPPASTIAHEVFHAACTVLWAKGLSLDGSSEEAFAYLIEFLTSEITRRLR